MADIMDDLKGVNDDDEKVETDIPEIKLPEEKTEELEEEKDEKEEGGKESKEEPVEKTEEEIEKLDLTEPEHIKEFREHYLTTKAARDEALTRITELESSIDELRANRNEGVYLKTDVPLEDFDPKADLARMKESDPEYYEALQATLKEEEFWPTVEQEFIDLIPQELANDDPRVQSMLKVHDALTQKMYGGLTGKGLYNIMTVVEESPDLLKEIKARFDGKSKYDADKPFTGDPTQVRALGSDTDAPKVQTVQEIAELEKLDPSEEKDLAMIKRIQTEQKRAVQLYNQGLQAQAQLQKTLKESQEQAKKRQEEDKSKTKLSETEITKQAEGKLTEYVSKTVKDQINARYAKAVADQPILLTRINTLVMQNLQENPEYQEKKAIAFKWLKQAQSTTDPKRKEEWQTKGVKAIGALTPIFQKAVDEEAKIIVGTAKRKVEAAKKAVADKKPTVEIPTSGKPANPKPRTESTPTTSIVAMKQNIIKRWEEQQGK